MGNYTNDFELQFLPGPAIDELTRLRAENTALTTQLASARADYAAALSALELANMPKVHEEVMYRCVELLAEANTRAERAEARIAELERDIAAKANNMRYMHDRFERAEAERDALRKIVEEIVNTETWADEYPWDNSPDVKAFLDRARAALAATVPVPRSVPSSPEVHVSQVSTEAKSPRITKPWGWDRVPG